MKFLQNSILFLLLFIVWSCNNAPDPKQTMNPIIGDAALLDKFGKVPEGLDENIRIATHLTYVENILRKKDVRNLTAKLQLNRQRVLDALKAYAAAGVFPKNYDYAGERKPCFIDKDGKICAVGYLIEQTAGRELAETINQRHKYDRIFEMKTPELLAWVKTSGLTLEECAMVQPTYGPTPTYNYNYISPGYGISSAILGGANLSLNAMNIVQVSQGSGNKFVPVAGLVAGASSIILGAVNLENEGINYYIYPETNESKKALSFLNIGLGSTTVFLSTWNLISNKTKKEKKVSWNVYSFPALNNQTGVGLSYTRKL